MSNLNITQRVGERKREKKKAKERKGNFKMFFEENEITGCNYIILVK